MSTATILDQAGRSLGGFLPRLGGALFLVVAGLIVARIVGAVVARGLRAVGVDELVDRYGVQDTLDRVGIAAPFTRVLGRIVRVALSLVVLFAALSLLGLQFLSESLNQAVLFIPNLLVALALVLAGFVVGGLVRPPVDRLAFQMDLPVPLGRVVELAVIAVFVITAAAQVSISTTLVFALLAILVAALAGTFTLAFGLGGRSVARELSAGRYVTTAYETGQTVTVEGTRGRIVAVEQTVTVLETGDGDTVRIPNHLMLERVIRVHGNAGEHDVGSRRA